MEENYGARTINIPDTVGYAIPDEFAEIIKMLMNRVPNIDKAILSVHCHNDLGLAVANSLAAIKAGARQVECTINGLGERAGIARTEEVVAWLVARRGAAYDVVAAGVAARALTSWIGRDVPPHAPVIGSEVFACESGLHLAGLVADPATYEPYPPELVGAERIWRLGRGTGRAVRDPGRVPRRVGGAHRATTLSLGICRASPGSLVTTLATSGFSATLWIS